MVITSAFQADDEGSIPFFRLEANTMEQSKKDKLTTAGFQIGTAEEFLNLSDDEIRTIEDKIREYKPRTSLGKKLIDNKYSGILLDADSLLNELERGKIDPNEWLYKIGLKTPILGILEPLEARDGYAG